MTDFTLHLGDCLETLKTLPDCSVDSVITDPPYGLSQHTPQQVADCLGAWLRGEEYKPNSKGFMGKSWDAWVPSPAVWRECLRVLKPGGHLLAFAGTRSMDLMSMAVRLAGFELRDSIGYAHDGGGAPLLAWVYGSGFPKSLDVSKAIDKAAGAGREVIGMRRYGDGNTYQGSEAGARAGGVMGKVVARAPAFETAPATEAARQWQGWGTALKPALETVTFASKPYTAEQERDIIQSNLIRLESRIWLLLSASAAEKNSTSNPSEYGAACAIAQWSADEIINTRAALCGQMDTSRFESATTISLSIVSSWRRTLAESWNDGNTSTIETRSSTTIDWRTLKFSLSQITPSTIIKACSLPGGFSANASTAENHFNASLSLLQSILTLSATEPAISQAQHEHLGAGVTPNLDPCIMARKPLSEATVAANVLEHGTGALNIDGCRVASNGEENPSEARRASARKNGNAPGRPGEYGDTLVNRISPERYMEARAGEALGRWPANLIHDGSDEVVAGFPNSTSNGGLNPSKAGAIYGNGNGIPPSDYFNYGDTGSAARFFYCAKASKRDRDEGLDGFEKRNNMRVNAPRESEEVKHATKRANTHPTVKPTDLMRYLCRLVTPPNGTVLDPFTGSGSTGKAAILEGLKFIGCEMQPDYYAIAKARIEAACTT